MATPSTAGSDASRVRVQPERRQQPDLAKLAAALIELATEQLNNNNNTTTNNTTNTGTSTATPSTSNADVTTVTPKVTLQTPARSRRRGRVA